MTTPFRTSPNLISNLRGFAMAFATRHLKKEDLREEVVPTPSASLDSSRKEGGCREEVRRMFMRWLIECPTDVVPHDAWNQAIFSSEWLDPSEVYGLRRAQATSHVARAAAYKTAAAETLEHRVLTVPERGWKRRVVSAPPAFATVAGTVLNRAMLRGVRRYGPCAMFLRGDRKGAVEQAVSHASVGCRFVSTDLTAATDRLPLDLIRAVVDGLCDGWSGLPPVWAEALYALTGTQTLRYPWGQTIQSESGVLMGLGPSWPIMSIIHAWWVELAASRVGIPRSVARRTTAIGGDDLLGAWPPRLEESYRRLVLETNGKPSKGKDFSSDTSGNFTEMTFWVVGEAGGTPQIRWSAAIPTKGIVGTSIDELGAAYESLGSEPGRCLRGRRVLKALRPHAWRVCREAGVSVNAPRLLGGAGLPPLRGSLARVDFKKWHALALGKFLYGSGQDQIPFSPPSWVEAADPAVWEARQVAEQRLRAEAEIGIVSFDTRPLCGTPGSKHVVQSISDQMAWWAGARVFSDTPFPPVATEMVSLKKYHRLIKRWCSSRTKEGIPSSLAVKSGRNSRFALTARARRNRDRWVIRNALFDNGIPVDPRHRPII
nr:MAG: RNA-dependent RNA polymerase [Erysiphe necator associated narnavirus 6]